MAFLELRNITKIYQNSSGITQKALSDFSIIFPNSGLVGILGESGSGKSTIINLIALLDSPTSGDILLDGQSITKWSDKKKDEYRNKTIGVIFQHYNLLEEETALFNVMLPMLISGQKHSSAKEDSFTLLEGINFPKDLYKKRCADLSGGEKQRVGILRSLINNPQIILADEPTGALDGKNAIEITGILKQASRKKLVILISHNEELVSQYADRIITISDGKCVNNKIYREENNGLPFSRQRKSKNKHWMRPIIKTNFLKGLKRNLIGCFALTVSLIFCFLIIGFSSGSDQVVAKETLKQLDYGCLTLCNEITKKVEGSPLSIVKQSRPDKNDILRNTFLRQFFFLEENLDALTSGITIQHKNQHYREVVYCPIYSFEPESINSKLLAIGETPKIDSLANVIINDKCAKEMRCKVNDSIHLTMEYEYIYYTEDEHDPAIHNYWKHDFDAIVSAIVDELDFLETPKVYYSYVALQDLAQTTFLTDLSQHYGYDISWLDLISNCSNSDAISSYNYRLFLKDARQMDKIPLINEKIDSPLSISSGALEVSEALFSLIDASTMGMEIFLVLCFGGASLILGIISFSNFTLDKKKVAILRSLGARKNDILDIYGEQCLDVGLIGVLISFVLSPLFALIANRILFQITSFHDLVQIPLVDFFGVPFLLPLAVIILTILLCFLVTWIPITFSGKISLKQELSDE